MKTLDEVIKALEICWVNRGCNEECPYQSEQACTFPRELDALHYLKEYQRLHMAYVRATADIEDNPPLTWDELRQMEGKPVWVEADDGKYTNWFVVGNFFSYFEKEDFDAHVNLYTFGRAMEFSKETYGSYWQAYRKERG